MRERGRYQIQLMKTRSSSGVGMKIDLEFNLESLKISDLPSNYSAFGGKGDVWGDTAHIYKSGEGNLCGKPALSSNWVRLEGVEHIGCPTCLAKYNS
jgi:hypothetical protein